MLYCGNIMLNLHKQFISIVVPVFRSSQSLPKLVEEINLVLQNSGHAFEIILVCDGSPDNSWNMICELHSNATNIVGINLRKNVGQHNALMAGLRHAQGDMIVTMDDDLQHNPSYIPVMINKIDEGFDLVYAKFSRREHSSWKVVGSKLNSFLARKLISAPRDLYLSPFRAMTSELCGEVVASTTPFLYLDGTILELNPKVASIEVQHEPRIHGDSNYNLRKSISLAAKMATSYSILPLRLTTYLGITMSFFSFSLGILFIVQKLTIDVMPIGWTSLITALMMVSGLQLLSIGVLGEYLGRLFRIANGQQQYHIKEIRGRE
jgi:undecaprenyl-phosphate 4-deoxy-4-formamido-L-arabinose transferase